MLFQPNTIEKNRLLAQKSKIEKMENKKNKKNQTIDLTADSSSEKSESIVHKKQQKNFDLHRPTPKNLLESAKSGQTGVKVAVTVPSGVNPGQKFNVKWKEQLFAATCPPKLGQNRRLEFFVPSKNPPPKKPQVQIKKRPSLQDSKKSKNTNSPRDPTDRNIVWKDYKKNSSRVGKNYQVACLPHVGYDDAVDDVEKIE